MAEYTRVLGEKKPDQRGVTKVSSVVVRNKLGEKSDRKGKKEGGVETSLVYFSIGARQEDRVERGCNNQIEWCIVDNSQILIFGFCRSKQSRNDHGFGYVWGDDSAGVKVLEDGGVLLVVCDGVSGALGRLPSRTASGEVVSNGGRDLPSNLNRASEAVKSVYGQKQFAPYVDTKDPRLDKMTARGCQTMCNQILLDPKTGQVSMLYWGDGGAMVVSGDEIKKIEIGSTRARLCTLRGIIGQGQEGSLNIGQGEILLMHSDGVVCDESILGLVREGNMAGITELLDRGTPGDDQTLFVLKRK